MGIFATDKNQITLIYNGNSYVGKQTYAYIEVSEKKILAIDISKTKITGTQWVEIAEKLNLKVADLIAKEHPNFTKNYDNSGIEIGTDDAIKILQHHPETFVYPVVINGTTFIRIESPSDFVKFA